MPAVQPELRGRADLSAARGARGASGAVSVSESPWRPDPAHPPVPFRGRPTAVDETRILQVAQCISCSRWAPPRRLY